MLWGALEQRVRRGVLCMHGQHGAQLFLSRCSPDAACRIMRQSYRLFEGGAAAGPACQHPEDNLQKTLCNKPCAENPVQPAAPQGR